MDVLSRLLTKTLLGLKCVYKRWHRIISNRYFIQDSSQRPEPLPGFLFQERYQWCAEDISTISYIPARMEDPSIFIYNPSNKQWIRLQATTPEKESRAWRNWRRSASATTNYSETKVPHIPHSWKNQPIYVILMLYRVVGYQQVQEVSCNVRWCIFLNGKLLIRSWENWRKRWRKRVSLFQGWPHKISFPRRN